MRKTNPDRDIKKTENHHIFPVSIFGENKNIVKLTVREHFVAHKLLYMIYKQRNGSHHRNTKKMLHALRMMMLGHDRKSEIIIPSYWFELVREHNMERIRGDKNPAKLPLSRKKISEAKTGVPRPDIKGKSYFGADPETVAKGIEKMVKKKTGMKINYPKNRNSPPCSEEKAIKISEIRMKTKDKFIEMKDDEFKEWISAQNLYTKDGKRKNSNVTRVLHWRKIPIENYYT
jgi:hypothetical protein